MTHPAGGAPGLDNGDIQPIWGLAEPSEHVVAPLRCGCRTATRGATTRAPHDCSDLGRGAGVRRGVLGVVAHRCGLLDAGIRCAVPAGAAHALTAAGSSKPTPECRWSLAPPPLAG